MKGRVTARTFLAMKADGRPIAMLTAYDHPTAHLVDAAGVDAILVGDSLGNVVQGRATTLPVTLEEMIYHTGIVARATERALVVADMPFGSYQEGPEQAIRSATRLFKEASAQAVKLEGGREVAESVRRLVTAGMPVMGHIGLTPQSVHALGGFAVQGRTAAAARRLLDDALALEEAGAFAVVLELVPREVAALLTRRLTIPTIGIGSGPECDGQVLVFHDMVGLDDGHGPRHARRYAEIGAEIRRATAAYVADVAARRFPAAEESHSLPPEEREAVLGALGEPPAGEGR